MSFLPHIQFFILTPCVPSPLNTFSVPQSFIPVITILNRITVLFYIIPVTLGKPNWYTQIHFWLTPIHSPHQKQTEVYKAEICLCHTWIFILHENTNLRKYNAGIASQWPKEKDKNSLTPLLFFPLALCLTNFPLCCNLLQFVLPDMHQSARCIHRYFCFWLDFSLHLSLPSVQFRKIFFFFCLAHQ